MQTQTFEPKDEARINDIIRKAGGHKGKMRALATRMARSITTAAKARRRARAAEDRNYHDLAEIFHDRYRELIGYIPEQGRRPQSSMEIGHGKGMKGETACGTKCVGVRWMIRSRKQLVTTILWEESRTAMVEIGSRSGGATHAAMANLTMAQVRELHTQLTAMLATAKATE